MLDFVLYCSFILHLNGDIYASYVLSLFLPCVGRCENRCDEDHNGNKSWTLLCILSSIVLCVCSCLSQSNKNQIKSPPPLKGVVDLDYTQWACGGFFHCGDFRIAKCVILRCPLGDGCGSGHFPIQPHVKMDDFEA